MMEVSLQKWLKQGFDLTKPCKKWWEKDVCHSVLENNRDTEVLDSHEYIRAKKRTLMFASVIARLNEPI